MVRRPSFYLATGAFALAGMGVAVAAWSSLSASDGVALLPEVPEHQRQRVTSARVENLEATIPPQCYTRTEGRHNPCYTCHQLYDRRARDRLNELDDGALQGAYTFSDVGVDNHHRNLFADKSAWIAKIDDDSMLEYVRSDNYSDLAARLRSGADQGYIPDLRDYADGRAAFDMAGLARDGSHWVAFNYKPFPGTFWPTNGSTDDVLIRLPKPFREVSGHFSRAAYFVNLTLVELVIQGRDKATIEPVEEGELGVDLDGDGRMGRAETVLRRDHYVGDARDVAVEFEQMPAGTEFLHAVRYLDVDAEDRVVSARRMKELRYMRKVNALPRSAISSRYAKERKEKLMGELPRFLGAPEGGLDNALGWVLSGFVEDYEGRLRRQSLEEAYFCMGCHSAMGTTVDSTFSLARKVPGRAGFGYVDLVGMIDAPTISEPGGEILNYLKRAGGGSEFRENPEMRQRWYHGDEVDEAKVRAADVYTLVTPSARRALDLNKAYTYVVRHQSYALGRDATWEPAKNVFERIDEGVPPLDGEFRHFGWDLRLSW